MLWLSSRKAPAAYCKDQLPLGSWSVEDGICCPADFMCGFQKDAGKFFWVGLTHNTLTSYWTLCPAFCITICTHIFTDTCFCPQFMFFTILTLIYFTMYVSHPWICPAILRALPPVGLLADSDMLWPVLQGIVSPSTSTRSRVSCSLLPMWWCMRRWARFAVKSP